MKKSKRVLILQLLILLSISAIRGQTAPDAKQVWQSVAGSVVSIDRSAGKASVKTEDGKNVEIGIGQKAVFLRIKPNEKNLENAEKISLSQVVEGAKILARGQYSESGFFTAQMIVVVSSLETIAGDKENSPVAGTIIAIDAATKRIKAGIVSQEGTRELTLDASSADTKFYSYAAGSLKFNNSVESSFDKIKVGDQFKSVGKISGDSGTFVPKTLVFGTFRTFGGKVTAIDLNKKEFTFEDASSRKPASVKISDETVLRMLDAEKAEELIDVFFKNISRPGERKNFRVFFDELPTAPTDRLSVGDNLIISVVVNDAAMSAFYILKDVKPVLSYLEKQQKKGKPLPNLGGINL